MIPFHYVAFAMQILFGQLSLPRDVGNANSVKKLTVPNKQIEFLYDIAIPLPNIYHREF